MNSGEGEYAGKEIGDIYGAEHFCRLLGTYLSSTQVQNSASNLLPSYIVTLPELIAQTNMDKQSVNHLREELSKITTWLGKNLQTYFHSAYEHPGQEYTENARRG